MTRTHHPKSLNATSRRVCPRAKYSTTDFGPTDRRDHITQYSYDDLNRLTAVLDALKGTTHLGYDKVGNLTRTTDDRNHTTTYGYDDRDRTTHLGYNKVGNLTRSSAIAISPPRTA
jgi:YD repeat-containing protein